MDVAATLELLRDNPYFRSLPQTALQRLATSLRERWYQPGDVIFRKGDRSEGLGVVLRGRGEIAFFPRTDAGAREAKHATRSLGNALGA